MIYAVVGVGIATWLSLFQLGVISTIWEPFFGDGSRTILNSSISHVLPVPDAALGAFGYLPKPYELDELHDIADLAAAADAEMIAVIEAGLAPGDAEDAGALLASVGCGRAIVTKLDIARRLGGLIGVGEAGLAFAHISASPYIGTGLAPATALRIARALLDDFAIDWYRDDI